MINGIAVEYLLVLALAFSAFASAAAVVTVEPGCAAPMDSPHISIRYNPRASGARLASAQSLRLVLATALAPRYQSTTIPMTLEAGTWQADFAPKKNYLFGYSIFFFEDEKGRVDNNRARYWDILRCGSPYAVVEQAKSYEGRLLAPGVQRRPDLARALDIIRTGLKQTPDAYMLYFMVWKYELKLGEGNPAAYQQAGRELDAFISAHGDNIEALQQVVGFVAAEQQKLPPAIVQRFREAVAASPRAAVFITHDGAGRTYPKPREHLTPEQIHAFEREAKDMAADLDYSSEDLEQEDLKKKADDYLAFAAKYPESPRLGSVYARLFEIKKELHDVPGAEAAFEKWTAVSPANPRPLETMAEFYIAQESKPEVALKLLASAAAMYRESEAPSSHHHYFREPGRLEFLQGQAHVILNDLPAARADLEAAAKAAPEKADILYALGQVCEQMNDNRAALNAYLASASAPYQDGPAPQSAFERLFLAQKLGSKQDAGRRLFEQVAERTRRDAAEYTPVAMSLAAPEFAFDDLGGKRVDNRTAKGGPAILSFWAMWCAPCVAELPALEKFQQQHPGANLLAVEIGDTPEQVKAFLAAHNIKALRVAVAAEFPAQLGATAFPTTIVMDRFGEIQFVHEGQLADVEAILEKDLHALPGIE